MVRLAAVEGGELIWVQGWFEDVPSLQAKIRFIRDAGLGGMALFPLAYGDLSVWRALPAAR